MKWKVKIKLLQLDVPGFLSHMDEHMRETTEEAARSWLRVVTAIVPVWSGASMATFDHLAAAVNWPLAIPGITAPKQRINLGQRTSKGGVTFKSEEWYFYYETDLRYLAWNEYNSASKGDGSGIFFRLLTHTPYKFQEAGIADFKSLAAQVRLPNPYTFLKQVKI